MGSSPSRGSKILHAAWHGQKIKISFKNKMASFSMTKREMEAGRDVNEKRKLRGVAGGRLKKGRI